MSPFLQAAKELIYPNGIEVVFKKVIEGVYDPNTSSVVNTETSTTIKSFPKNIKATVYNYPNLVGKEVMEFLVVATDLTSKPDTQDKIVKGSDTFLVERVRENYADGQVIIYQLLGVKG